MSWPLLEPPSAIVVVTLGEAVSITETVSSLALVTYALEPSAVNAVFHGVLPTATRPTARSDEVSSTTTSSCSESVT